MFHRVWSLAFIAWLLLTLGAAASPASLGSAFADAYTTFAPLYAFYRSYADYLFVGSEVIVPPGFGEAAEEFSRGLEALHMEFILQTDSQRVEEVTYLAHLRGNAASFCARYHDHINAVAAMEEPDLAFLEQAAAEGLFAAISELNELFQEIFTLTLENLEDAQDHWAFGVAFVTRTLINREAIEQIDSNLEQILLGSEDTPSPPPDLPVGILGALESLVSLSGKDLTVQECGEAKELARRIHAFLVGGH